MRLKKKTLFFSENIPKINKSLLKLLNSHQTLFAAQNFEIVCRVCVVLCAIQYLFNIILKVTRNPLHWTHCFLIFDFVLNLCDRNDKNEISLNETEKKLI